MRKNVSKLLKGIFGILTFALLSSAFLGNASAATMNSSVYSQSQIASESDTLDFNAVMQALDGKEIKDGDQIPIDDDYVAICDISTVNPRSSRMTAMNSTNTYTTSCNIYIMHLGTNTMVAYSNHSVSVTYYDNGLVHINSGSLTANSLVTYVSTYPYGYSITNTDGSYSYAGGVVRMYDATISGYYYYGCTVSVTPGSQPSFSFSPL